MAGLRSKKHLQSRSSNSLSGSPLAAGTTSWKHCWITRGIMRKNLVLAAGLSFLVSTGSAQAPSDSRASTSELLSMDQQIKIAQLITKITPPLTSGTFSIAMNRIVPANIELHLMPPEAERLAPQLRGFGYVVVEEQITLVHQSTRKIELVFPRWGKNN